MKVKWHRSNRKLTFIALAVALCISFAMNSQAQLPELEYTRVSEARGIVDIANAGDGSDRLFLVQQLGNILILKNGETLQTPFLAIGNRVASVDEQGLLSVAFAPDYKDSGNFYIWYTQTNGSTVLSRFKVTDDPDLADPASEEKLLIVPQPYPNHNGGRLQFGPDGMLYLGLGDGGSGNDPEGRGQDGSTLLGKLIRIDVDPANSSYAIPADNPFVTNNNFLNEIWAIGLRNPWRISFDSETGDLYIADVGQRAREEVNFQAASSAGGENYGWVDMEGSICNTSNCDPNVYTLPVAEYGHDEGCSISGGEVYRGTAYPRLVGTYLFADWCTGNVWGLSRDGNQWVTNALASFNNSITTFGPGEDGSIYLAASSFGVYLISDGDIVPESFQINPGLNDAWFDQDTNGQGFFIVVYPDESTMFLSWFTYETERPDPSIPANLGEAGHRWVTAQGSYANNQAVLDIYITAGGVFDRSPPVPVSNKDGTMIVEFKNCTEGTVTYDIPSIERQGVVPIKRVANDNIPLCEALEAAGE